MPACAWAYDNPSPNGEQAMTSSGVIPHEHGTADGSATTAIVASGHHQSSYSGIHRHRTDPSAFSARDSAHV